MTRAPSPFLNAIADMVREGLRRHRRENDPLAQAALEWLRAIGSEPPWPTPLPATLTRRQASGLTARAAAMRGLIRGGDVDPALGLSLVVWPGKATLEAEALAA